MRTLALLASAGPGLVSGASGGVVLQGSIAPARCEGFHYGDVDWQRPQQGVNGAVVYPHRCRRCGVEVLAVDIADAGRSCT